MIAHTALNTHQPATKAVPTVNGYVIELEVNSIIGENQLWVVIAGGTVVGGILSMTLQTNEFVEVFVTAVPHPFL